jgi:hypothetical protein
MCYNSFHLETLYLTVKLLGKLQVNCIILLFYNMLALISETFKGSLWGYLITVTLLPAMVASLKPVPIQTTTPTADSKLRTTLAVLSTAERFSCIISAV